MALDENALRHRAEVARRLKAARWLAGSVSPSERGKTGYEVRALSTEDLARRSELRDNGITAARLGAIERMERHTPPMELQAIAGALRLPVDYFEMERVAPVRPDVDQVEAAARTLSSAIAALGATPVQPPSGTPGTAGQDDMPPEAQPAPRRGTTAGG
jgi:transcriptional regulator with XRE-family HTH domain